MLGQIGVDRDYTCVLDQLPDNFGSGMSGYNAFFTLDIEQIAEIIIILQFSLKVLKTKYI